MDMSFGKKEFAAGAGLKTCGPFRDWGCILVGSD